MLATIRKNFRLIAQKLGSGRVFLFRKSSSAFWIGQASILMLSICNSNRFQVTQLATIHKNFRLLAIKLRKCGRILKKDLGNLLSWFCSVCFGLPFFVSVQLKHRNSLFRQRRETTERNVLFWILPKLVSVPILLVSKRNWFRWTPYLRLTFMGSKYPSQQYEFSEN